MISTLSVAGHSGGCVIVGGGGGRAGAGIEAGADIDRGLASSEGPEVTSLSLGAWVSDKLEI